MAPWADLLYACDGDWWDEYIDEARKKCQSELWAYDFNASEKYGLNRIEGDTRGKGLGRNGIIHTGGNSGYQAVNLVYLLEAKKIILLGFDMQRTNGKSHWHGDHPQRLNRTSDMKSWVQKFNNLARDLREAGIEVINATRETALDCFKRVPLEVAL